MNLPIETILIEGNKNRSKDHPRNSSISFAVSNPSTLRMYVTVDMMHGSIQTVQEIYLLGAISEAIVSDAGGHNKQFP
jgi:hypothetical protein